MKDVEWSITNESPLAVHGGASEAMEFQQSPHLVVGPLLKMEALEGVAELAGDIVGTRIAVRGVEDVNAPRLEQPVDHFKVGIDVVGVEVLEELVAEDKIGASVGQVEVIPVVNDELEVLRKDFTGGTLVGDVDAVDLFASRCRRKAQPAIPGGELDEDGFRARFGKMGTKEPQLLFTVLLG